MDSLLILLTLLLTLGTSLDTWLPGSLDFGGPHQSLLVEYYESELLYLVADGG